MTQDISGVTAGDVEPSWLGPTTEPIDIPIIALHRQLFDAAEKLPPMPSSAIELAAAITSGRAEIEEIAHIIRQDPILTTRLLVEANSAASAPASEVVAIDSALTRIGLARVLAISCSSNVGPQAQVELPTYQMAAGVLWEHSIRTSYVAEAIYRLLGGSVGPEVVTSALLHDIGQVVLDQVLDAETFGRLVPLLPIEEAERELLDVDHAETGGVILDMWGVPGSIGDAVRRHHRPDFAPDDAATVVSLATALADRVSEDALDRGLGEDESVKAHVEALGLELDVIVKRSLTLLRRSGR